MNSLRRLLKVNICDSSSKFVKHLRGYFFETLKWFTKLIDNILTLRDKREVMTYIVCSRPGSYVFFFSMHVRRTWLISRYLIVVIGGHDRGSIFLLGITIKRHSGVQLTQHGRPRFKNAQFISSIFKKKKLHLSCYSSPHLNLHAIMHYWYRLDGRATLSLNVRIYHKSCLVPFYRPISSKLNRVQGVHPIRRLPGDKLWMFKCY